jgi:hypothetical protein
VSGEHREEENNEGNDEAGDNAPPKYPGSQPPTPGPEAEFDSEAGGSRFLPQPPIPFDEDEPIPVDNRSEWVRAERALGS